MIDIGERLYPPDIFPGLWQELDAAMTAGGILIGSVVISEMRRVTDQPWRDTVYGACTAHAVDVSRPAVQIIFARLSSEVAARRISPKLSDNDLLLLSCAEADGIPIVTRDGAMEAACLGGMVNAQNVRLIDVFRSYGWQF